MTTNDDVYVAVRKGRLSDLLELADHASREVSFADPQLSSCLNGAVAEIRTDIRELV